MAIQKERSIEKAIEVASYDLGISEPTVLPFAETLKDRERAINTASVANRDAGIRAEKQTFRTFLFLMEHKWALPASEGLARALLVELLLCN